MSALILPGHTLEIVYPHHNIHGIGLEFVERRVHIIAVEDFGCGLPVQHFLDRPLIRRGRTLVRGIDRDSLCHRKFWWESRRNGELIEHRLGLVDPNDPGGMVDWVGRIFGPTREEQVRMRKVALKWLRIVRDRGYSGLSLRLYPWPQFAVVSDNQRG